MTEHIAYKCPPGCDKPYCQFCKGGLFACIVCGSAEGATTTDCPNSRMTPRQQDEVYAGRLNFRNGQWRLEPSYSCSSHYVKGQPLPQWLLDRQAAKEKP